MIRIVYADISSADAQLYEKLYEKVSFQRQRRADRYPRQEDKLRCVAAGALLRVLPEVREDRIALTPLGKPYVTDRQDLHFSLSHSGRYVVLAWGSTPVGVDVQQHDPSASLAAISARFFAPDEQQYAQDLPRFYELWTKKESYLKYTGTGLHRDLRAFSVLRPEPNLRYFHCILGEDHSLSLCTEEAEYQLEQLDLRLLP